MTSGLRLSTWASRQIELLQKGDINILALCTIDIITLTMLVVLIACRHRLARRACFLLHLSELLRTLAFACVCGLTFCWELTGSSKLTSVELLSEGLS